MTDGSGWAAIRSADEIDHFEKRDRLDRLTPCTIEHCHQPHKDGYAVVLKSGARGRIGHICGKGLLGEGRFTVMERELEARERSERLARWITSPVFDPDAALAVLNTEWRAALDAARLVRSAFMTAAKERFDEMVAAVNRRDGQLRDNGEVGDLVHVLRGGRWATSLPDAEKHFLEAVAAIKHLKTIMESEALSEADMETVARDAEEALRRLPIAADIIDAFAVFCDPDNVIGVTAWMDARADYYGDKVEAKRDGIRIVTNWPKPTSRLITIPPPSGKIDRKPLKHLAAKA